MAAVVGRTCVVVRGRARSCAVVRAWSVIRGRAWSCAVGRARSYRSARFAASTAVYGHMRAKFGPDPTAGSKILSFKFISRIGVRSLANASRARQFNPLNPSGVGWVPLPQTNMAAVVGRARSCVVMRALSVMRGRAQSVVVVRGRACVVVRGRAVLPARFAASTAVARTNERTTSNNPLNPPGVGWVNFFYFFKVRISIRTCVPTLGSFRRPCRKFCLSNL